MEKVAPSDDLELHLLTEWGTLIDPTRRRKAAVWSVAVHAALILVLASIPADIVPPERVAKTERVTPLIEPPAELTQRAPNTRKINKEFNAEESQPRPRIQIPSGAPSTTRPRAPRPAPIPTPPAPKPSALPEPPKLEAGLTQPVVPPIAQPQIQPVEQPKLPLENPAPPPQPVPPGQGRVPIPNPSVSKAIRQSEHGASGAGHTVGHLDLN